MYVKNMLLDLYKKQKKEQKPGDRILLHSNMNTKFGMYVKQACDVRPCLFGRFGLG
ncbi:hypothetical protein HYC85_015211 [Camellia sinensis]|uniref:Uncharacterized protein n=1 Tax=Camellia sinensis TaxID=4442 RepID=A0A7J7GW26_CAMSI|nr:hypothetical protein HYC85_015211 [Camellia sinensis]